MISQEVIDRIYDAANAVEVIGDFVHLKKRGANYTGLCPFHNEKTPSFSVSPSKNIYKCFGCGEGGNPVNFIMQHEHLSYQEALKYLAKKYNIEIIEKEVTAEELAKRNEAESMMIVTAYAQKHFTHLLHQHPEGKSIGLSYFKERNFTPEIIDKFELGYSLEARDAFTKSAIENGYKKEYLVKTGLTIEKNNHVFDRFAGRVMFPIHSMAGKVIGFGGRILKKDAKAAKYLNSPESEIYHKSRVLFGLYQAKQSIIKQDKCFLVEGYTDVMALHQAGVENVVAASGTSLTQDQIRMVKRFTNHLTIIFDGDPAGIKASLRGIDMILEEGMNVRVVPLPEGEDPDSFAKNKNQATFFDYLNKQETDFISFKLNLLLEETQNDPVQKAQLISNVVASIAMIPDGITRSVYIKQCSTKLETDEKVLYAEVYKKRRGHYEKKINKPDQQIRSNEPHQDKKELDIPVKSDEHVEEKELIRLLINYGQHELYSEEQENEETGKKWTETFLVHEFIRSGIEQDELSLRDETYKKIYDEYFKLVDRGLLPKEKYFIENEDQNISKTVIEIISSTPSEKYTISQFWKNRGSNHVENEEMVLKKLVPDTLFTFKEKAITRQIKEIDRQIQKSQQTSSDLEHLYQLQQQSMSLKTTRLQLHEYKEQFVLK